MKEETKIVFERLQYELTRCHYYWILYRQLFGTNKSRIDLINKTNPSFLVMYQDLFYDYLTLELSKLTDPAEMGKFKNLTFFYLIDLLKNEVSEEIYNRFDAILKQLSTETEFFRNRRNKIVAHRDLVSVEQKDGFGISRQRVEDTLLLARNYLNEIELHFFGNQTMYREFITAMEDDGTALLINLAKSLAYDDLVEQQKIPFRLWESFGKVYE